MFLCNFKKKIPVKTFIAKMDIFAQIEFLAEGKGALPVDVVRLA